MATSSLFHRPIVRDQQTAERLLEVLESGAVLASRRAVEYRELSGDEIRTLFTARILKSGQWRH